MEVNNRILKLIKNLGVTQSKFAEDIGIARQTINHITTGKYEPSAKVIQAIAKKYDNLNLKWLISGEGKMFKEFDNNVSEPIQNYGQKDVDLRQALEDCRKDKERAWAEVEWLRNQIDEIKKKEAS